MPDQAEDRIFPIPEDLKNLLIPDDGLEGRWELIRCLVLPATAGEIIKLAALADEVVAEFLGRYIAVPKYSSDDKTKKTLKQDFNDRIKALTNILPKLDSDATHYTDHFEFLGAIRQLRNKSAHSSGIGMDVAKEFAANAVMVNLVADFPKRIWAAVTSLKGYLGSLSL